MLILRISLLTMNLHTVCHVNIIKFECNKKKKESFDRRCQLLHRNVLTMYIINFCARLILRYKNDILRRQTIDILIDYL